MIPQLAGHEPLVRYDENVATNVVCMMDYQRNTIDASWAEEIRTAYEDGHVVALPSLDLGMSESDWNFINAIKSPASLDHPAKKAKMKHILVPIGKLPKGEHILNKLGLDDDQVFRMQLLIRRVNERLYDFVVKIFPTYKFLTTEQGITWRFTTTESEELHYDNYGFDPVHMHHVRLFVNVDDRPRLWGIGPHMTTTLANYKERFRPHKDKHPNVLNFEINQNLPWTEVPRHYAMFLPGNAWLVNSQLVAHEIIYGRKLIACTFDIDPASMLDPAKSFNNRAFKAVSELYL